jgi:filamentous hemagglutinin family protein
LAALAASPAYANPQGGQVSAGQASIHAQGPALTVVQHTDRAVLDWSSFNIAPGETTRFDQPSASSAILNRIHDQDPSKIEGNLSANGQVFLVNPNGMVFGKGAKVDVGSLAATSAGMADDAFMRGGSLEFRRRGNADAKIVNEGHITVREGGLAALVAPEVRNDGSISAKAGKVAMASGDTVTLDFYGDGLVSVAAAQAMPGEGVTNTGTLAAPGGTVLMTTAEAAGILDRAINMSGILDVSSAVVEGGEVRLYAHGADADISGTIHADSVAGTGGRIAVTGDTIRVGTGAILTALGATGGGDIKIGGEYQGGGTLPHAKTTTVEKGATLDASATGRGDGGQVVLWSDEATLFKGNIAARGGPQGGHGGSIETSSKGKLGVSGDADASAPHGEAGSWLLDPSNVTISSGAGFDASAGGTVDPAADSYAVDADTIQTALNSGTSVTITTVNAGGTEEGTIRINAATTINKTAGGAATLTLKADENIATGDPVVITSSSGPLTVIFWADADNNGSGSIYINNLSLTTNGGNFVAGGGANPLTDEAVGNAFSGHGISMGNGSLISTGAGNISLRGRGQAGGAGDSGILFDGGPQLHSTSGNITLTGFGGNGTGGNRGIYFQDDGSGIQTDTGAITLTGTGGMGAGINNYGIFLEVGPDIISTGTGGAVGTIQLTGIAGAGTDGLRGFVADGCCGSSGGISSVDADIIVTGTGGNSGAADEGINIGGGFNIASTGSGNVTLTGTSDGDTCCNTGVLLSGDVSVKDGTLTILGSASMFAASSDNYGVQINSGNVFATGNGAISVTGNGGGLAGAVGSGANMGIRVENGGTITGGDGGLTLTGTGGPGGGSTNYGIRISGAGSAVTTTGDGDINITGTGGGLAASGTGNNHGVRIDSTALVSAVDGDITITGLGGASDTGDTYGIYMNAGGDIASTGTGASAANIILNGTGGPGAANRDYGILLEDVGTTITTVDGDISITGVGSNGGTSNYGVCLRNDASITSTGTGPLAGTITFDGTGGIGTNDNIGVYMNGHAILTSQDGDIHVTGLGRGTGAFNLGVFIQGNNDIDSTGTGLNAADILIEGTGSAAGTQRSIGVSYYTANHLNTVDGDITFTGFGGGNGTSDSNFGLELASSSIDSTGVGSGAGQIHFNGTGGDGSNESIGIILSFGMNISSVDGGVFLTGQGGDGGFHNTDIV